MHRMRQRLQHLSSPGRPRECPHTLQCIHCRYRPLGSRWDSKLASQWLAQICGRKSSAETHCLACRSGAFEHLTSAYQGSSKATGGPIRGGAASGGSNGIIILGSERWQSGRSHPPRKRAYLDGYREFESPPLRQQDSHRPARCLGDAAVLACQTPYARWLRSARPKRPQTIGPFSLTKRHLTRPHAL